MLHTMKWRFGITVSNIILVHLIFHRYILDGKKIDHYPGTISDLARVEVEYVTLPGWQQCTENIRNFTDLPENAQNYVRFIEKNLEVPVQWVGVGKGRESIIKVH